MRKIFVSSTFRDMNYERDILSQRVVPQLNQIARSYGEGVSVCDLRWGVNTEELETEEGSRKVLSVCLDEIDQCRPYMIVLLGERYGWIPSEQLIAQTVENRRGFALDELEKSVTALEIEYGALSRPDVLERTLFYFRELTGDAPVEYQKEDERHWRKLEQLKARIRKITGGRVKHYQVQWDARKQTLMGLDAFAEMVTADVRALLEDEWKSLAQLSPFERDQRCQWNLAQQYGQQFRGRESLVQRYMQSLQAGTDLMCFTGSEGIGKTTLLSHLALLLREQGHVVLPIFCGSTELCETAPGLIQYIVEFLETGLGLPHLREQTFDFSDEYDKEDLDQAKIESLTEKKWKDRLQEVTQLYARSGNRTVYILLDALEQLPNDRIARNLDFVPARLEGSVKFLCAFEKGFYYNTYRMETLSSEICTIPGLEPEDRQAVVEGILKPQGRNLSDRVIRAMLQKKDCGTPMYLSLLVQRLLMMNREDFARINAMGGGMEEITAYQLQLVDACSDDLEMLCTQIMEEAAAHLDGDTGKLAAQYLAEARRGLREQDLMGIASTAGEHWNNLDFSRFVNYLSQYFIHHEGGRYDFSHPCFRRGIRRKNRNRKQLHQKILAYLKTVHPLDDLRIYELPYHCIMSDDKEYFLEYISLYREPGLRPLHHTITRNPRQNPGTGDPADKQIVEAAADEVAWKCCWDDGKWMSELFRFSMERGGHHSLVMFVVEDIFAPRSALVQRAVHDPQAKAGMEGLTAAFRAYTQALYSQHKSLLSAMDLGYSYQVIPHDVREHEQVIQYLETAGKADSMGVCYDLLQKLYSDYQKSMIFSTQAEVYPIILDMNIKTACLDAGKWITEADEAAVLEGYRKMLMLCDGFTLEAPLTEYALKLMDQYQSRLCRGQPYAHVKELKLRPDRERCQQIGESYLLLAQIYSDGKPRASGEKILWAYRMALEFCGQDAGDSPEELRWLQDCYRKIAQKLMDSPDVRDRRLAVELCRTAVQMYRRVTEDACGTEGASGRNSPEKSKLKLAERYLELGILLERMDSPGDRAEALQVLETGLQLILPIYEKNKCVPDRKTLNRDYYGSEDRYLRENVDPYKSLISQLYYRKGCVYERMNDRDSWRAGVECYRQSAAYAFAVNIGVRFRQAVQLALRILKSDEQKRQENLAEECRELIWSLCENEIARLEQDLRRSEAEKEPPAGIRKALAAVYMQAADAYNGRYLLCSQYRRAKIVEYRQRVVVLTEENVKIHADATNMTQLMDAWFALARCCCSCDWEQAETSFLRGLETAKSLADMLDPSEGAQTLIWAYNETAGFYERRDQASLPKALAYARDALAVASREYARDGSEENRARLYSRYDTVNRLCERIGVAQTVAEMEAGCNAQYALLQAMENPYGFGAELVSRLLTLGLHNLKMEDLTAVKASVCWLDRALELAERLNRESLGDREMQRTLMNALRLSGMARMKLGGGENIEKARELYYHQLAVCKDRLQRGADFEGYRLYLICLRQIIDHPLTSSSEKKVHLRTMIHIYQRLNKESNGNFQTELDACTQELRRLPFGFLPWI